MRKGGIQMRKASVARVRGIERRRSWRREWVHRQRGSVEVL